MSRRLHNLYSLLPFHMKFIARKTLPLLNILRHTAEPIIYSLIFFATEENSR